LHHVTKAETKNCMGGGGEKEKEDESVCPVGLAVVLQM